MRDPQNRKYIYSMMAGFGAISLSVLFFFFLFRLQGIGDALDTLGDILAPFGYGCVVAYLLRPLCNLYDRFFSKHLPGKTKRLSNGAAVCLSLLTGLLIVYAMIIMIAPQLYYSIRNFWNTLPEKADAFYAWAANTIKDTELLNVINAFNSTTDAIYTELDAWASETVVPYVSNILGGVTDIVSGVGMSVWKLFLFLKNLLIGLIVAVYLLASRKKFKKQGVLLVRSALKPKWADFVLDEIAFVDRMFGGFIDGKLVDSAIIGVLCYIGCMIFQFPNKLLISAIIGITNVIPFFGPFIGAVPATILILLEEPTKAIWFVLFVLALQQLDGNVIGPKILGDRTGLSSFWVLFSIILCGGLWGLFGMIICVPLFAVLYDMIKRLVCRGLEKHGQMALWEKYKAEYPDEESHRRSTPPKKTVEAAQNAAPEAHE